MSKYCYKNVIFLHYLTLYALIDQVLILDNPFKS